MCFAYFNLSDLNSDEEILLTRGRFGNGSFEIEGNIFLFLQMLKVVARRACHDAVYEHCVYPPLMK